MSGGAASQAAANAIIGLSGQQRNRDFLGQTLATDAFVASELAAENWAPGGKNFSPEFNDRGTLIGQSGSLVVTPSSATQVGNFSLQTGIIGGTYQYVNDLDADHPIEVHAPFDITANATGTADNTTDTSEVRVNLQWVGQYSHPEDAYDGGPAGTGAVDIFTYEIEGNAAAQYFSPNGSGGSNVQPGLPDLPDLPDLPQFGDQPVPSELRGNPYNQPGYYTNNNNSDPYNPYNPQRYTDPNYNPYNPNPGHNPYQSTYQATGAPDTSPYLTIAGGPASEVNNQSQFDISWMTEIQRQNGEQSYLDYGSFSSAQSAAFRGIFRPTNLTAVNQQALNDWIRATGTLPSTIATQINVLSSQPGGVRSFTSQEDYQSRQNNPQGDSAGPESTDNPFNYNTLAGGNSGSNASRESSYQGTGTAPAEFGGAPTSNPLGYNNRPTTGSGQSSNNRLGQNNVASTYDGNAGTKSPPTADGYTSPSGDPLSYGGATGADGYDSEAERDKKIAEQEAALAETRKRIAAIEELERLERESEETAELVVDEVIEIAAYVEENTEVPTQVKVGENPEEQERLFEESLTIDPEIKEAYERQQRGESSNKGDDVPENEVEISKVDVDADFENRFGKADNGGYEFDDPYGAAPTEGETPKEIRDRAYGGTIQENGWEEYVDLPASEWDKLPDSVRNDPNFVRIKVYEYVQINPDATPNAIGDLVRGLTNNWSQAEELSLIDWGGRVVSDPTSYVATANTLVEIKDDTVDTFTGIWNAGVGFVKSSNQNKRIAAEAFLEAVLQTGVDVLSGKHIALVGEAAGAGSVKLEEFMTPEAQEALIQDFMLNPDKYFQVPVKVSVAFLVEELTTGGTGRIVKSTVGSVVTKLDDIKFNYKVKNSEQISLDDIAKTDLVDGEVLIGKGGFGEVYFKGEKGKLYKVMREPDQSKALYNAKRQYDGYTDLKQAGIPVAEIHGSPRILDGKVVLEIDDLEGPEWGAASGKFATIKETGISSLTSAERDAFTELIRDIDSSGMVWGDAKPANAFFFRENGKLKAGVLDHDLIMTKEQYRQFRPDKIDNLTPKQQNDLLLVVINGGKNLGSANFPQDVLREAKEQFIRKGLKESEITPNELYLEATKIQQLRVDAGL